MRLMWKLFIASLKMMFRQREAILWTVLLPLFMIGLFSFVRFDGMSRIDLGVVNEAGEKSALFIASLKEVDVLRLHEGKKEDELKALGKGDREMVLIIPSNYAPNTSGQITALTNDAKPAEAKLGALVLQRVMDEMSFAHNGSVARKILKTEPFKSRNLTYFDFVAPGILSMSIMQVGIFGVAFGFVALKKRGILRRLWATPIRPLDFIMAQVGMRLVLVMLQILIMTLVPYYLLDLHFIGSFWQMFVVGLLGAIVFLAMGFAISGISKSEDQVAPLANIIAMPMMILSGIFFSRNSFPGFVRSVVDLFPLSFLADAMRAIAIDGATLAQVLPQIGGLVVWCVISVFIAVKMFRWE